MQNIPRILHASPSRNRFTFFPSGAHMSSSCMKLGRHREGNDVGRMAIRGGIRALQGARPTQGREINKRNQGFQRQQGRRLCRAVTPFCRYCLVANRVCSEHNGVHNKYNPRSSRPPFPWFHTHKTKKYVRHSDQMMPRLGHK